MPALHKKFEITFRFSLNTAFSSQAVSPWNASVEGNRGWRTGVVCFIGQRKFTARLLQLALHILWH